MKNLLITGGAGFIGANFIRHLFQETSFAGRVVNVDSLTYAGNQESLKEIEENENYYFEKVDICDLPSLSRVFDDYGIDCVVHFAAESHVDRSIEGPGAFVQTNVIGTFNLLECCRERLDRIERFHHISTDEVYGSLGATGLFTEKSPYQPNSPYSASKAASDHFVRAYAETYGLPITLSNCSNNYGPYQFPEKLVPLVILNMIEGKSVPLYGDGLNVRDWLYIDDHCEAIWAILQHGSLGETYNIGGNQESTNLSLVEKIADHLDRKLGDQSRRSLITFVKDRPGHDRRYAIDASKLKMNLGWEPKESLEMGLEKTIDWYLENETWVSHVRSGEYRNWISRQYAESLA